MPTASGPAASSLGSLSPRQMEVLALVAQGLSNADIARVLFISIDTVRSHVSTILGLLELSNRTEAATFFFQRQLPCAPTTARALAEPAIAILPLQPLEVRARVRLAAVGITRDLASLFARYSWFPVILLSDAGHDARTQPLEAGQAAGARFIASGTLRAAGRTMRLELQVADTVSGRMLWSDVRDFPANSLFEVQDEITASIVARAYERLLRELGRGRTTPGAHPERRSTWELAHAAYEHHRQRGRESHALARQGFRKALAREPHFVFAHFGAGVTAYDTILNQWGSAAEARRELRAHAQQCLTLAPHMAEGHFLEARGAIADGATERAVPWLESAITTNPSFAAAHALLAQVHTINGRLDEGLARIQVAARLSPQSFTAGLAVVHFARHEWSDALAASERVVALASRYSFGRALAAASAYWLGDKERARVHAGALVRTDTTFAVQRFRKTFGENLDLVARMSHALEASS